MTATFHAPEYRPPVLPAVALELHQLSRRPDVQINDAVALLNRDPLLTADVLRKANSPLYAAKVPPKSIRDVIVRLGLENLQRIVWDAAVSAKVFRSKRYAEPMRSLQRHSTVTAHIAAAVSSHSSMPSEYAFLCGLLHDVGLAGSLLILETLSIGDDPVELDVAYGELDRMHEELSKTISTLWELPQEIQWVVGNHHRLVMSGYVHPLTAIVCIADHLTNELGVRVALGSASIDHTPPERIEVAWTALNLSAAQRSHIEAEAERAAKKTADAQS